MLEFQVALVSIESLHTAFNVTLLIFWKMKHTWCSLSLNLFSKRLWEFFLKMPLSQRQCFHYIVFLENSAFLCFWIKFILRIKEVIDKEKKSDYLRPFILHLLTDSCRDGWNVGNGSIVLKILEILKILKSWLCFSFCVKVFLHTAMTR